MEKNRKASNKKDQLWLSPSVTLQCFYGSVLKNHNCHVSCSLLLEESLKWKSHCCLYNNKYLSLIKYALKYFLSPQYSFKFLVLQLTNVKSHCCMKNKEAIQRSKFRLSDFLVITKQKVKEQENLYFHPVVGKEVDTTKR